MRAHDKINYVEFPSSDIVKTKRFFETAFGWSFVDYGPDYAAFTDQGLDGGFFKAELTATSEKGSALIVFFSADLGSTQAKVEAAGGQIAKPIFSFPGGRRFHFIEPGGNEFAVWGEDA